MENKSEIPDRDGARKKILFIEDEPDQIMMVRLRLEKNGYEIFAAQEGREGLDKAIELCPDLVLLDIVVPGLDGFEICKRLKKNPRTQKIPIIVTTAAGQDDIEQLCLLLGAEDCVRKPYDSSDLVNKIKACLGD
jgi:two-component system, OmpR family, alkaline phosphatase synthesis response regulator PhoP